MSDIFISYAREDRETVQRLANALEAQGWSVWWDTRLKAGEIWDDVIARELAAAHCVIVLWSKVSVERNWVRVEAREGLRRRVLVPVRIEDVEPPLEFGRVHVGDLIDWNGHETHPGFKQLMANVSDLLGSPTQESIAPPPIKGTGPEPAFPPSNIGATSEDISDFWKNAWRRWLASVVATIKRIGAAIAGWRLRKHHLAMAGGIALLVLAAIVYSCYKPPREDGKLTPPPEDGKLTPSTGPFETDTHGITAEVTDFFMAGESARLTIRVRAEKGIVLLCMDPAKAILVDERTGQEWKAASFSHSKEDCSVSLVNQSRAYWMSFHIGEDLQTTYTALIPGLAEPIKRLKVQ